MKDTPSHQTFLATSRFASLDGLRALSIIAVLWHHSGGPESFEFLKRGQLGVHLFFAISGLLITTLLLRELEKYGRLSIRDFFLRRALRIFPLYYAVLGVYVGAVALMERGSDAGREFFSNLPYFLTYTTNWFVNYEESVRTIFYFSWSLATEEQFYLVFPWVIAILSWRGRVIALIVTLSVVYLIHTDWPPFSLLDGTLLGRILWSIAPCILLGALAALLLHTTHGFAAVALVLGRRSSFPVVLATVAIAISVPRGSMLQEYLVFALLVALVIAAVVREDHMLSRLLRISWVARVGVISYGMYLMHMLSFNVADKIWQFSGWPNWIGRMTIGVIITVVVAELSFRTFESWFLRRKESFSRK